MDRIAYNTLAQEALDLTANAVYPIERLYAARRIEAIVAEMQAIRGTRSKGRSKGRRIND